MDFRTYMIEYITKTSVFKNGTICVFMGHFLAGQMGVFGQKRKFGKNEKHGTGVK